MPAESPVLSCQLQQQDNESIFVLILYFMLLRLEDNGVMAATKSHESAAANYGEWRAVADTTALSHHYHHLSLNDAYFIEASLYTFRQEIIVEPQQGDSFIHSQQRI